MDYKSYQHYLNKTKWLNIDYLRKDLDSKLAIINGFFDFKQPTEKRVRDALIWSIGDEDDIRLMYGIKGESISDNLFESSLSMEGIVVAHFYGESLEDVLITPEKIRELLRSKKETKKILEHTELVWLVDATFSFILNDNKKMLKDKRFKLAWANLSEKDKNKAYKMMENRMKKWADFREKDKSKVYKWLDKRR